MKPYTPITIIFAATFLATGLQADDHSDDKIKDKGPDHHLTFHPDEIEWQDGPASFKPGSQVAILEGDPAKPGFFTLRAKLPDGFIISPHWHPNVERLTVISGIFRLGSGEEFNADTTVPLEPGTYTSMPPKMRHFAIAEGETVIQLTSIGPWEIHYVNPEDDPRLNE